MMSLMAYSKGLRVKRADGFPLANCPAARIGWHFDPGVAVVRHTIAMLLVAVSLLPCTASAKAKPGRYVVDAMSETVMDTTTKLTWQRAVRDTKYNWQGAKDYCKALPLSGGGWRLPMLRELESIVDFSQLGPCTDTTAFPKTPTAYFWSTTVYKSPYKSEFYAWVVGFYYGYSNFVDISETYRVRCVR